MKKTILTVLLTTALLSCSSPLEKKYSKETFQNDIAEVIKKESLDSTSRLVLMGIPIANAFGGGAQFEGKTYREIIDEAKKKEAEAKALAEKAAKEEADRIARLSEALAVAVFDKGFYEADYQSYITVKFVFDNKTAKEIRALTGVVVFTDLFDKEIKSISVTYDQAIAAKKNRKWDAQIEYNRYKDSDQLLASKKLADLKVQWKPEKILFSDGSSLE
jgi:hypothetical protein